VLSLEEDAGEGGRVLSSDGTDSTLGGGARGGLASVLKCRGRGGVGPRGLGKRRGSIWVAWV
jgi:hypothetical protein